MRKLFYFTDDTVDVTSEPLDQDVSVAASHNPNKRPQLEVQLGGAVTLQCPQGKQKFSFSFLLDCREK